MTSNGLAVFDTTLQKTHIWLDEIMEELAVDRQGAWHVLGAVLRALRDRIPLELGAHLSAQLPLLVRGTYYDQFRPSDIPMPLRHWPDFVAQLSVRLGDVDPPVPTAAAAEVVFRVLSRHIDPGEIAKVQQALPEEMRERWDDVVGAREPLS